MILSDYVSNYNFTAKSLKENDACLENDIKLKLTGSSSGISLFISILLICRVSSLSLLSILTSIPDGSGFLR